MYSPPTRTETNKTLQWVCETVLLCSPGWLPTQIAQASLQLEQPHVGTAAMSPQQTILLLIRISYTLAYASRL